MRLQEPSNLNGSHIQETIYYLIGEHGYHTYSNNFYIEFGSLTTNKLSNKGFETVSLNSFPNVPIILTQVQTYNGKDYVVTRTNDIQINSFKVTMQEEDKLNSGKHTTEIIGWVAISPGNNTVNEITIESNYVTNKNHNFSLVNYNSSFSSVPNLITKVSSYSGKDPCNTRIKDNSTTGFNIKIHEDTTRDNELNHVDEIIGYVSII